MVEAPRQTQPFETAEASTSSDNSEAETSARCEGRQPRFACASHGCKFLINSDLQYGGYCCKSCGDPNTVRSHCIQCEKKEAPAGTPKAHEARFPIGVQPEWHEGKTVFAELNKLDMTTHGSRRTGAFAVYEVVHDRVVLRSGATRDARMVKTVIKGERLRGTPYAVGSEAWLRIDLCELEENVPKGVESAWALLDGSSLGLGPLLSKISDADLPPALPDQGRIPKVAILTKGSRGDLQPVVALALRLRRTRVQVKLVVFDEHGHQDFMAPFGFDVDWITESSHDFFFGDFVDEYNARQRRVFQLMKDFHPDLILYRLEYVLEAFVLEEQLGFSGIEYSFWPHTPKLGQKRFLDVLNRKSLMDSFLDVDTLQKLTVDDVQRRMDGRDRPVLYAFSEEVVERSPSWTDPMHTRGIQMFGYWLLNAKEQENQFSGGNDYFGSWADLQKVEDFLESGEPPVYIGWGSMNMLIPNHLSGPLAVRALMLSKQRGVVLGSYTELDASALASEKGKDKEALLEYAKENILFIKWAPHEVLMPKCSVIVHHGGNGTTAASLRSGKPTVVTPVIVDQFYWGNQVERLGVGVRTKEALIKHLGTDILGQPRVETVTTPQELADAIEACLTNSGIAERAAAIGERLRNEDGVSKAAEWLATYARHLAGSPQRTA